MEAERARGFTLVEVMITVAIIAILAIIAYPAYNAQLQKARRADATTALLGAAQQLERCFTRFDAYDADGCPTQWQTENGFYLIAAEVTPISFLLTAEPTGPQQADLCGSLTLNQLGQRTPAPAPHRCWGS
jgi:type IV pilus assembly protein PilE